MTKPERQKANDWEILVFLHQYDPYWRLVKLLGLKRLMEDRESFKEYLHAQTGAEGFDDTYVYTSVTNGILLSAVSELTMQCEDFMALLKYIREREYFVRSAISYSAGKVANLAGRVEAMPEDELLKALMVPGRDYFAGVCESSQASSGDKADRTASYNAALDRLLAQARGVARVYSQYAFFYGHYKHGLSVAMRALGTLTPEGVAARRNKLSGTLFCYDNRSIEDLSKKGVLRDRPVLIPGLDAKIQPFLSELSRERNLLLLHNTVHEVDLDSLISISRKVALLVECLCRNRSDLIEPTHPGCNTVLVPAEDSKPLSKIEFCIRSDSDPLTMDDFCVKL